GPLGVAPRLGTVGDATTDPDRGTDRAVAGTTEALLPPRLGAATAHLTPGLRRSSARPPGSQLGGHDLMQNRHVRLDAEYLGIEVHGSLLRAVGREQGRFELSHGPSPPLELLRRSPWLREQHRRGAAGPARRPPRRRRG